MYNQSHECQFNFGLFEGSEKANGLAECLPAFDFVDVVVWPRMMLLIPVLYSL